MNLTELRRALAILAAAAARARQSDYVLVNGPAQGDA